MGKKGNHWRVKTQGFQYLGNPNWTISNLLSRFCCEIFPAFDLYTGDPISYYPRERKRATGKGNDNWNHPTMNETQRITHPNWTFCNMYSWFWFNIFSTFDLHLHTGGSNFLLPQPSAQTVPISCFFCTSLGGARLSAAVGWSALGCLKSGQS